MTPVLDHGFVTLLDCMGSDQDIEAAARVSYAGGASNRKRSDTRSLIRYLMRHRHETPFEMAVMKFHIRAPIFVARQWMRHRAASVNEISARYSELPECYYTPDEWRAQSTDNKQGSDGVIDYAPMSEADGGGPEDQAFAEYNFRLAEGIAREQARMCLPLGTYTEWIWQANVRNLLHFLGLRMHPHAQKEIRVYAEAIAPMVQELFPLTWEAFRDYRLDAITFSAPEVRALRSILSSTSIVTAETAALSERERRELQAKLDTIRTLGED